MIAWILLALLSGAIVGWVGRWYFDDAGVSVVYDVTVGDVATVSMVREAVAASERRTAIRSQRESAYGHSHADRFKYDERN